MKDKLNKHPCLLAFFSVLLIIVAFMGSTVVAGIRDRSSKIDLMPDPQNYIRLPNVDRSSNFLRPEIRTKAFVNSLVSGTTNPGQTGRNLYNTPAAGEAWLANDEGNLMYKGEIQLAIAGKTVVIDSVTDLTALTGETSASGNSIFWMDWGNHYIVDPYSIAFSGGTNNPIAGTTTISISGISGIMRSVLEKDDQKTITLEIAQTGATGWAHLRSGTTPVTVWAPLNSGATTYNATDGGVTGINAGDSGVTHQSLNVTSNVNGSELVNTITNVADGGKDSEVQRMGEWKTWKADYLAGVSVIPVKKYIIPRSPVVRPTFTDAAGYTIDHTAGKVWEIDLSVGQSSVGDGAHTAVGKQSSGITVSVPTTITAAMDGQPMTFIVTLPKGTAGTTNMVLWAGATATSGVSIENSTGVTNDALDADAEGDSITLIPSFTRQIYFYQGSRIQ